MSKKGVLTVISGFSGAGKGTIMRELIKKYPYFLSTSATTRKPREGETDGKEYFFHTREEFQKMIEDKELIEWAEYVGNYYGTPRKAVEQQLNEGNDVLLEIEIQGGMLVKEQFPDALLVFITPPSAEELKRRLVGRGTESAEEISRRLARAAEEAPYMESYDYIVTNDVLEDCVEQLNQIISGEHCRSERSGEMIQTMQAQLKQFVNGGL
jgi:guanylate kinase